jgi:hypothetical protein
MARPQSVFKATPFCVILEDGLERLFYFLKGDVFTFVVNGESLESTVAEAVLLSPNVYESLQSDPNIRTFVVSGDTLNVHSFRHFQDIVLGRDHHCFSNSVGLSFLSLCQLLGNERLSLLFLNVLRLLSLSKSTSKSDSDSDSKSVSSAVADSSIGSVMSNTIARTDADADGSGDCIVFDYVANDFCASRFDSHSIKQLQRLDKRTLHNLLGSSSLRINTEETLLQILIDLGSDYFEFFSYLEVSLLSSDGLSLFVDQLPFDELTVDIWSKVVDRLKGICKSDLRSRRHRFESSILQTIPDILSEFRWNQWKLLYLWTADGFSSSIFHSKGDGHPNTVTVIETTKDFIFGSFTPIAWDSTNSNKPDSSERSFVFTLKNPRDSAARKFALKDPTCAIHCHSSRGPSFGGWNDIHIADVRNANTTSCTNLGCEYVNDTGISGTEVFTGERHFTAKEIEVFTIDL